MVSAVRQRDSDQWLYGGKGNLFPDLSWDNRPDMSGSGASLALQDVWTASMLAIKAMVGRVAEGACYQVLAAVLSEAPGHDAICADHSGERCRTRRRPTRTTVG